MKKRIIALCGFPETGKSKAQEIIQRRYGAIGVDDGQILREAAMTLYNLTPWHVTTQEGKRSLVEVSPGNWLTVRKILGELGKYVETHDINFVAQQALTRARIEHPDALLCFASVRREQGAIYAATGEAIILEIRRAGCVALEDFDRYNPAFIDATIENDFDPSDPEGSLLRLEQKVAAVLDAHFDRIEGVAPVAA